MRDYGIVAVFVALFVVLSLASPAFFSRVNLLNILDQWSATLIIAVAGTLVLIAGGFDLSVGSIYAFSGVIAALTVGHIGAWAQSCSASQPDSVVASSTGSSLPGAGSTRSSQRSRRAS